MSEQSTSPNYADTVRAIRSMLGDEFHPQSTVFGDVTRVEAVAALLRIRKCIDQHLEEDE